MTQKHVPHYQAAPNELERLIAECMRDMELRVLVIVRTEYANTRDPKFPRACILDDASAHMLIDVADLHWRRAGKGAERSFGFLERLCGKDIAQKA
ncbi:hypothetical protein V1291_000701 [Nitrobacteraceae bacterium AZCC 1564]